MDTLDLRPWWLSLFKDKIRGTNYLFNKTGVSNYHMISDVSFFHRFGQGLDEVDPSVRQ